MKRDMDIVRRIVLALQDDDTGDLQSVDGVDDEAFRMHGVWVVEAGLALGLVDSGLEDRAVPSYVHLQRLTWSGCDFADAIADDTLWAKAKEHVLKPTASWSFDLLLAWLKAEAAQRIGINIP